MEGRGFWKNGGDDVVKIFDWLAQVEKWEGFFFWFLVFGG